MSRCRYCSTDARFCGCWDDDEIEEPAEEEPTEVYVDDGDRAADAWERWRDERYA